jgi:hypothetical protein
MNTTFFNEFIFKFQWLCYVPVAVIFNKTGNVRTYNVTLKRVRKIIVTVEKQYFTFWLCVCSLSYPALKRVGSFVFSSVAYLVPTHFHTLSHERENFRKKISELKMCVLIFSTVFIWNISYSEKKWARYGHKCENVSMQSIRDSCRVLMKLEFSRLIFEKNSNMKFH